MNPMRQAQPQRVPLLIMRAAFVSGVLMFGAVIWFLHQNHSFPTRPQPPALAYAQIALSIGAVIFAFVSRGRIAREPNEEIRDAQLLIRWALGQGAALMGGVVFLLSGDVQPYLIGVLAMFISFALLPIRQRP
jgi:hypothetical protein